MAASRLSALEMTLPRCSSIWSHPITISSGRRAAIFRAFDSASASAISLGRAPSASIASRMAPSSTLGISVSKAMFVAASRARLLADPEARTRVMGRNLGEKTGMSISFFVDIAPPRLGPLKTGAL